LVGTEQYLCGRAPLDAPERRRVRSALRRGYESVRRDALNVDEAERDCYLLLSTLTAMCWFPVWYADRTGAERNRLAAQLRTFVRDL
ncbi:aminoglycoside phosphotransferase, partial [Halobium palmae]